MAATPPRAAPPTRRGPPTPRPAAAARPKAAPPKVADQQMLVGGKWVPAASGKTFETLNPATREVICRVAEGDKEDVDRAVKAARNALENGPWGRMNASARGRLLHKL